MALGGTFTVSISTPLSFESRPEQSNSSIATVRSYHIKADACNFHDNARGMPQRCIKVPNTVSSSRTCATDGLFLGCWILRFKQQHSVGKYGNLMLLELGPAGHRVCCKVCLLRFALLFDVHHIDVYSNLAQAFQQSY